MHDDALARAVRRWKIGFAAFATAAAVSGLGGCGGGNAPGAMRDATQGAADPATTSYHATRIGPGYGFAVNASGQVAGNVPSSNGEASAFLLDGSRRLEIRSPDRGIVEAIDLNDAGQVVGSFSNADGVQEAFSWTSQGGFVRIAPRSDKVLASRAHDVNQSGQVVGTLVTPQGDKGFLWSPATGLVTRFGEDTYLASALRINDTGLIAGEVLSDGRRRPVLLEIASGALAFVAPAPAGSLRPAGPRLPIHLNDAGEVAGSLDSPLGPQFARAFYARPREGLFVDLEARVSQQFPGRHHEELGTFVTALNERGEVLIGVPNGLQAYFWSAAEGLGDMRPPAAGSSLFFNALNRHGVAVGLAEDRTAYALAWTRASGAVELERRIVNRPEEPGRWLRTARAINDRGQILGLGEFGAVLLTPVAEGLSGTLPGP
ncbi:hypothetical protein [Caldimonas tepidiphila]|uniref:hypothetical protein n=1 Tax=Caldimonas tepidiphila TaxID=2315841 RepID=UPI000E5B6B9C|nr:hypothetical protein [Caldimonas tepidiphila]